MSNMPIPWDVIIPAVTSLVIKIVEAVKPQVDAERWQDMGPKIASLVQKAVSGEDFSHDELMKYIPRTLEMELLQARKKTERIEKGLAV